MTRLMLDYDGVPPADVLFRLDTLCHIMDWHPVTVRQDRTRNGWHVVVELRERVAFPFVVAAQAILGSDPVREMYNLQRARQWRHVPAEWRPFGNVLYARHIKHGRRIPG